MCGTETSRPSRNSGNMLISPQAWELETGPKSILPEIEPFQVTRVPTGTTKNTSREEKLRGAGAGGSVGRGEIDTPPPQREAPGTGSADKATPDPEHDWEAASGQNKGTKTRKTGSPGSGACGVRELGNAGSGGGCPRGVGAHAGRLETEPSPGPAPRATSRDARSPGCAVGGG